MMDEQRLREIEAQLRDAGISTHWVGCETTHTHCAIRVLITEVRRLQQQAEGQPVLKTEWQRLESARDAALAERDAAVVRFHDWSGTDVPALNIALTAARQDAHEQRQRAEQAEAALTEARRVLREVEWQKPAGWDDGYLYCPSCKAFKCVNGNEHDHTADCALAAVLAQDTDA